MYDPLVLALVWCGRGDLNPHGFCPLPPQDSVSTKFHHFRTQLLLLTARATFARRHQRAEEGSLPAATQELRWR